MNRINISFHPRLWLATLFLTAFVAGCGGGDDSGSSTGSGTAPGGSVAPGANAVPGPAGSAGASATDPTVGSASPGSGATNVPTSTNGSGNVTTGSVLTATFTQAMNPATIISPALTFTLKQTVAGTNEPGTVTMNAANTVATFTPVAATLLPNTSYTATITTAAQSAGGTPMANPIVWSFTTSASLTIGQAPVDLRTAGNFVILAKDAITNVSASAITGNIGLSPTTGSAIDVTCAEMTGTIFTVDAAYVGNGNVTCVAPGPGANKDVVDQAILDMGTARTDAAGRSIPDTLNQGAGEIGGLNISPGLHKWTTGVTITTNVTLTGSATDVWIFQIAGDLDVASGGSVPTGIKVVLAGGAKASNIFWQVGGVTGATLDTFSTFNGIILSAKQVRVRTGAVVNGRLFADSQVTLQQNPVTQPAP